MALLKNEKQKSYQNAKEIKIKNKNKNCYIDKEKLMPQIIIMVKLGIIFITHGIIEVLDISADVIKKDNIPKEISQTFHSVSNHQSFS